MLKSIIPKLPMRNKITTENYYIKQLGFQKFGCDFDDYLMVEKDDIEIHFFAFPALDPLENYGQMYIRTNEIDDLYNEFKDKVKIHPSGRLESKPWGQKEFSVLDPDHNLITFGQNED
jgi:hypothetical protein